MFWSVLVRLNNEKMNQFKTFKFINNISSKVEILETCFFFKIKANIL